MATKRGQLSTLVDQLNPWWRERGDWTQSDRDLAEVRGSGLGYETTALRHLHPGGLYTLRGPRRVGKTVATKQAISSLIDSGVPPTDVVRLAVDGWPVDDLQTVLRNLPLPEAGDRSRWWFIDEISGVDGDWAALIKWMRDNVPAFGAATVVVTGSNAGAITRAIGLWAGRRGPAERRDRTLLPIGFRTFCRLALERTPEVGRLPLADLHTDIAGDAYRALLPWLGDLARAWGSYLNYGGFPTAVVAASRGRAIPPDFVDDMLDVIFRDAFSQSRINKVAAASLVARLMAGMANPLNLQSIAEDVSIGATTVERHLDYLRDSYLVWRCPQKDPHAWLARPKAQPKLYAIDPLVARLPFLRNNQRADVDPTILNEMMVGVAIRRAIIETGRDWEGDDALFYYRTPARKEIDFVSRLLGDVAIEGKYTSGSWRREAAAVEASRWHGILATADVFEIDDPERAWAVPAGVLAYLIDT